MVPHVGETDTDTLTEIPGRPAEAEEEVEDEFGYSWSEFRFLYFLGVVTQHVVLYFLSDLKVACHKQNTDIIFSLKLLIC